MGFLIILSLALAQMGVFAALIAAIVVKYHPKTPQFENGYALASVASLRRPVQEADSYG